SQRAPARRPHDASGTICNFAIPALQCTGTNCRLPIAKLKFPLRIAHYVPGIRVEQGGVVRSILDECSVLAARGAELTLITYIAPDVPRDWLDGLPNRPRVLLI